MNTVPLTEEAPQRGKRAYHRSAYRFPYYSLTDSILVAKAIHERGGGIASGEQLAAFLDYTSTNNGAYLNRVSAAKMFGLITSENGLMRLSPRGTAILMPSYPQDAPKALSDAFMGVPLFKAVYEETRGQQLPPEFGLKNLLRNKFNVGQSVVDNAYRTLMASAEDAGFFNTRGSRTHLIMPTVGMGQPFAPKGREDDGDDDGPPPPPPPPPPPQSREDLQNAYVGALIDILREKGKQGEVDPDLMGRIEKLLNLSEVSA